LRPSIENNDSLRLQFDDNTRRRSNLLRKLLLSFPPSASDCRKTEILNTEGETIRSFLERDHQRLDQLLDRASGDLDNIDMEAFGEFRRELLKHIGMEEKILLPAIQQLRGGEPLPIAARLRLDHGAVAALLVPTPRVALLRALKSVLAVHNRIEEGQDGVYAECDRIADTDSEAIVGRLRAAPEVPAAAHVDGPKVEAAARRSLARAGFDSMLLDS
jgi:Hemerythrin HHE cation binding domain